MNQLHCYAGVIAADAMSQGEHDHFPPQQLLPETCPLPPSFTAVYAGPGVFCPRSAVLLQKLTKLVGNEARD